MNKFKIELAKEEVIVGLLALSLVNLYQGARLIVYARCELLCLFSRDAGISWNDGANCTLLCSYSQGDRGNIEQHEVIELLT